MFGMCAWACAMHGYGHTVSVCMRVSILLLTHSTQMYTMVQDVFGDHICIYVSSININVYIKWWEKKNRARILCPGDAWCSIASIFYLEYLFIFPRKRKRIIVHLQSAVCQTHYSFQMNLIVGVVIFFRNLFPTHTQCQLARISIKFLKSKQNLADSRFGRIKFSKCYITFGHATQQSRM